MYWNTPFIVMILNISWTSVNGPFTPRFNTLMVWSNYDLWVNLSIFNIYYMSRLLEPYILILVSRKEVYKWLLTARVQNAQVIRNCLFPIIPSSVWIVILNDACRHRHYACSHMMISTGERNHSQNILYICITGPMWYTGNYIAGIIHGIIAARIKCLLKQKIVF